MLSIEFKDKKFAKKNLLPTGNNPYEIKYYATVEEIMDVSSTRINAFDKFHIWDPNHVKYYLGKGRGNIWILRVYKLKYNKIEEYYNPEF